MQLASTEVIKTITHSTAASSSGTGDKTDEPLSSEPKSQNGTTATEKTGKPNVTAKKTYCN